MAKAIFIITTLLYLLPFTIVATSGYIFEYLQILVLLLGLLLGLSMFDGYKVGTAIDYSAYLIPSKSVLMRVFVIYLILRTPVIFDILQSLVSGNYVQKALEKAVARYEGTGDASILHQFGTVAFIVFGFLLGSYNTQDRWKFYMAGFFIMMLIESSALARASVLLACTSYAVELIIRKNKEITNMNNTKLATVSFYFILSAVFVFVFSAYLRVSEHDDAFMIVFGKVGSYTIAMYEALYEWMTDINYYDSGYGFYTFTSFFKLAGVGVEQGFYPSILTSFGSTNIYTNMRGYLSDFGIIGSAVIFFFFGLILKYSTYRKMGPLAYLFVRMSIFMLAFVFYSPFLFSVVLMAFFFSYFILVFPRLRF